MRSKKLLVGALFGGFLLLYLWLNASSVRSNSYREYTFGADVPRYTAIFKYGKVNSGKIATRHPLPVAISITFKQALAPLERQIGLPLYMKAPYALFGALAVLVAYAACKHVLGDTPLALMGAALFGFSGAVLYFASVPESYIITTFFSSLFILAFLKLTQEVSAKNLILLTLWYLLSVLSEALTAALLVIPLVYFAREFVTDAKTRIPLSVTVLACALLAFGSLSLSMHLVSGDAVIPYYFQFKGEQSAPAVPSLNALGEVALNFTFFGIGYPGYAVTHALVWEPSYSGFFTPSLLEYFKTKSGGAFFLLYAVLLYLLVRGASKNTRLKAALLAYILLRMVAVLLINPWESYLYLAPLVLPWLVLLLEPLNSYPPKATRAFTFLFLLVLALNNSLFYIL